METFVLILMIWAGSEGMLKVEIDYDTMNDCETTSMILELVNEIHSTECVTVTDDDRVDWRGEQGV